MMKSLALSSLLLVSSLNVFAAEGPKVNCTASWKDGQSAGPSVTAGPGDYATNPEGRPERPNATTQGLKLTLFIQNGIMVQVIDATSGASLLDALTGLGSDGMTMIGTDKVVVVCVKAE